MNRFYRFGWLAHRADVSVICAIFLVFLTFSFSVFGGHYGYLVLVGPPPIHCASVSTNSYAYNPAQFDLNLQFATASPDQDKSAGTNSPASAIVASNTPASNPSSFDIPKPKPVILEAKSVGNPASSSDQMAGIGPVSVFPVFNLPGSSSSASDLLTVSPQMITQYLKPNQTGTNTLDQPGTSVFMPAGVQFQPPAPENAPESRAIYRSQ